MIISEIIKTTRTGDGTTKTVGGNEISRSTPKIGGNQTTSYADGSTKTTNQVGGIKKTTIGDPTTGNTTVAKTSIKQGNMKLGYSGNDPRTAKTTSLQFKDKNNKIQKATV